MTEKQYLEVGTNQETEVKVKEEIEVQRVSEGKGGGSGGTWQEWGGDGSVGRELT